MKGKITDWTWLWLSVLGVIITGELYTVISGHSNETISDNVQLLTLSKKPWIRWPVRVLILALFSWLGIHLTLGVWP